MEFGVRGEGCGVKRVGCGEWQHLGGGGSSWARHCPCSERPYITGYEPLHRGARERGYCRLRVSALGQVQRLPKPYRGTSLINNQLLLGPYCRPMPRAL